jgi:polypeptide N-acetylgalactosaminyltransferase
MDDYKRLFYMNRPDLMEASIGNLTNRLRFRQEKQCRSFKWFLDNIFPQKFVLDDPDHVFAFGRLRNPSSAVCFDTLQSDEKEAYEMGLYPCHKFVSSTQFFSLSKRYELRREDSCAELSLFAAPDEDESATDKVRMAPCHGRGEEQAWIHTKAGRIIHKETNKCLQAETGGSEGNGLQLVAVPCKVVDSQIWLFDNYIS